MAGASVFQDEFLCLVCQDLLKDPVTIPCGHSYCKSCITDCWDQEDQKRVYSCPQCRQTFSPRPALARNTMLSELVEKLKKRKRPADGEAEDEDVPCDVCTGRKYKAVKSCLVCLNSYCQNHLEQHESWFKGKRHNLTEATGRLQEMICQKHQKILEVFCRTDHTCICVLCTMDEHKNHDTVSAAAERTEKQNQLKETQKTFQQREKDLQQLREAVESQKRSAQTAVDSERIFTELIRSSIKKNCSELIRLIRDQEKQAVSGAEGRLERLEQEINDLRRRDAELEQLSHTHHHIQFLQHGCIYRRLVLGAITTLKEAKWNAPQIIPFTQDGKVLHAHLEKKHKELLRAECISRAAHECGKKNPEALSSTKRRKHITMSKILNLSENKSDQLADFLGHDIGIHRQFYRLPERTLQLAKMSKVLMAMEKGTLSKFPKSTQMNDLRPKVMKCQVMRKSPETCLKLLHQHSYINHIFNRRKEKERNATFIHNHGGFKVDISSFL